MQNHVINFKAKDKKSPAPDDLIKVTELCEILKVSYHYLYKWSVLAKKRGLNCIEPHYYGALKVSESQAREFIRKRSEKRWQG